MLVVNNVAYADATVAQHLTHFFANELASYTMFENNSDTVYEFISNLQYLNNVLNDVNSNCNKLHNMFNVISVLFADAYSSDTVNESIYDNFKTYCKTHNLEYDTYKVF